MDGCSSTVRALDDSPEADLDSIAMRPLPFIKTLLDKQMQCTIPLQQKWVGPKSIGGWCKYLLAR